MGGGYFPFFTENRPQKHKIHAFLHTSQANGGSSSPPRPPPPGYATVYDGIQYRGEAGGTGGSLDHRGNSSSVNEVQGLIDAMRTMTTN